MSEPFDVTPADFVVVDAAGVVVRYGHCQAGDLAIQASEAGEAAFAFDRAATPKPLGFIRDAESGALTAPEA